MLRLPNFTKVLRFAAAVGLLSGSAAAAAGAAPDFAPLPAALALPALHYAAPSFALGPQDAPASQPDLAKPSPKAGVEAEKQPPEGEETEKLFSFNITYYLYSDYVFRGVNYSDYLGEHGERLNHQMSTNLIVDIAQLFKAESGSYGEFNFGTFLEWYAGQRALDPEKGGNGWQETDYYLSWAYEVKPLHTTATLGYNFYTYPYAHELESSEWFVKLDHNDAWLWKGLWPDNEDGILNPFIAYYHDVRYAAGGGWLEFGGSHSFEIFPNFTATPGVTLAVDNRYLDRTLDTGDVGSTKLAYIQYGLNVAYELSKALKIPERFGSITLSGFLYFNETVGQPHRDRLIRDELFGGMSVGWSI